MTLSEEAKMRALRKMKKMADEIIQKDAILIDMLAEY